MQVSDTTTDNSHGKASSSGKTRARQARPSPAQVQYLKRGLDQPGGKLPLFDREGQRINPQTIRACMDHKWCEPWYANPVKPDWLVCRLTEKGRKALDC